MAKIIIMIILVNIVITIMSGPYDQNFICVTYLKIVIHIKYIFPVNKVALLCRDQRNFTILNTTE